MKKLYLIALTIIISLTSQAQQTIYVNQNAAAGGNGSSWATALDSLHEALVLAQARDEIWVAKGTYTPYLDAQYQVPADPREATFALKKDVSLYGSFAGNETALSQRNWSLDSTILSGEIGLPKDSDNVYNVLLAMDLDSTLVRVGGMYITQAFNAYPNSNPSNLEGGVMAVRSDSITLENCVVYDNFAKGGSGLTMRESTASIKSSLFKNNIAQFHGGAVYVDDESKLYCSTVLWSGNFADDFGGGIRNSGGFLHIVNSVFHNNHANYLGGALYNAGGTVRLFQITEVANTVGAGTNKFNQGFRFIGPGNIKIYNGLFTSIVETLNSNVEFRNCLLVGSRTSNGTWRISWGTDKGGNIDAKPLFTDSLNGNFNLAKCSPGIDAGKNNFIPADSWDADGDGDTLEVLPYDYQGAPRLVNGTVDMGAYEAPLYQNTGYDTVQFCVGTGVYYKGYYIDEAGVDTLVFQASAGCDSTVFLQANQLNVDTSVTVSADGATLTATTTGTSFLWFECTTGRFVFADSLPVFTPDTNGVYKVVIIDGNGCQDTSSCIAISTIGLSNSFSVPSVSVYPLPVKEELWIKMPYSRKPTEIKLYGIDGQLVMNRTYQGGSTFYIETGLLKKGTYVLHVLQGDDMNVITVLKD